MDTADVDQDPFMWASKVTEELLRLSPTMDGEDAGEMGVAMATTGAHRHMAPATAAALYLASLAEGPEQ